MKLLKLFRYYFLFLLIVLSLFSCKKDNSQELLQKAQNSLAVSKPDMAMELLDSIRNPESMAEKEYMHYIVTYIGAKYEAGKDITKDSLILVAQRYLNKKGKPDESAIANYYTAQYYDENANFPKALEFYMNTVLEADKSKNYLLAGKSSNNIGYIYYNKQVLDSAIINYQMALSYYDKVENAENRKLRTLNYIGRAYEESNRFDSAYIYYNKTLAKAIETNNEKYQSFSLQNLGVLCYNMADYDKAIEYYRKALDMAVTNEEHIRKIHIGMLMVYNKKQDIQSASQYADSVTANLPQVTFNPTLKVIYAALADYYNQKGDYKQSINYSNLEKTVSDLIEKEKNIPALLEGDKNFYIKQKEREAQELIEIVLWSVAGGVFSFLFLFSLFIYDRRDTKRFKQEIERRTENYDLALAHLRKENEKYPKIEAEIKAIVEEANKEKNKEGEGEK